MNARRGGPRHEIPRPDPTGGRPHTALVTGGSSGIGRAIVSRLAAGGVDLVLASERSGELKEARRIDADVLVNCAGTYANAEYEVEYAGTAARLLELHVQSLTKLCLSFGRGMIERGSDTSSTCPPFRPFSRIPRPRRSEHGVLPEQRRFRPLRCLPAPHLPGALRRNRAPRSFQGEKNPRDRFHGESPPNPLLAHAAALVLHDSTTGVFH